MRKQEEYERIHKNPDRLTKEVYSQFINYTTVKEMVDEIVKPILIKIPNLQKEMKNLGG